MTGNAHDAKTQPPPANDGRDADEEPLGGLHIAGIAAISLVALVAIVSAIEVMVACHGQCATEHTQHVLAVLGTLTAALASLRQGKKAKAKSKHHDRLNADQNYDHNYDFKHFNQVSLWWYIFLVGAVLAVIAESIDWVSTTEFKNWVMTVKNWVLTHV
jgi:hypothetical protein